MTDSNCIFCKIAGGEIPSATVYEDSEFRVILDLGPASRGHALILPKEHFKDLCELDEQLSLIHICFVCLVDFMVFTPVNCNHNIALFRNRSYCPNCCAFCAVYGCCN